MPAATYLPPDLNAADVACCLGLVSDTHMPARCAALPPALFDALAGCDLLIHAGDVGELWVIDRLSALAPVVAVHGNDDSPDAQRHLPFEITIGAAGRRIFLWHSHFPDWQQERAARHGDDLLPKLARTAERARAAGASLAVFGHWHIPLVCECDGVTIVNPGAIASGSDITRHLRQTVALIWLLRDGSHRIAHVDLGAPGQPLDVSIDWNDGFARVLARYEQSILDATLAADVPRWLALTPPAVMAKLRLLLNQMAQRVWAGEMPLVTAETLRTHAAASGLLSPEEIDLLDTLARSA